MPISNLVVGDIIDIHQGDRVPADCLLIEEMNITCDQTIYYPNDDHAEKEQSEVFYENYVQVGDNH